MIRGSSTGVRGVHSRNGKFHAVGHKSRMPILIGVFETIDDASNAYEAWRNAPKVSVRQERRQSDNHREERSSPEMYAIVEGVFRRCYEKNI